MSTVADYIGRRSDVLAFQGATPAGEVELIQDLVQPGESGQLCAGVQLLAQRVLLELLTEKGSMVYRPTRGTDFMLQLSLGYLQTPTDVMAALSSALVDVKRNLQADETSADPDDERYDKVEIRNLSMLAGAVALHLDVYSLTGTSRQVIMPISVTPGG